MYLIRLDDACEYSCKKKWDRIESIFDKFDIRPLVGVIPKCEDKKIKGVYGVWADFWEAVASWQTKGWEIALHGFSHVYETACGGINPIHMRSEFAGLPLDRQKDKISKGVDIFRIHNIDPHFFFAPGHTFDENTLRALASESRIRVISDTVASSVYYKSGFWFVPQQCGCCRRLPVKIATFCYHPNVMEEEDFCRLEAFLEKNSYRFCGFSDISYPYRKMNSYDQLLNWLYFSSRRIRRKG